jgi:glucose-6-phosphate 1-epimerase
MESQAPRKKNCPPNSIRVNSRTMTALPTCPGVTVEEDYPGFPVLVIKTEDATAHVSLYGAQVLKWVPEGLEPVLYLSPKANFEKGKAIRGGIPICWPWFGAHPEDSTLPNHGFARTTLWKLLSCEPKDKEIVVKMQLPCTAETKKMFPQDFELTATISIGAKISVGIKTRNLGEKSFQISSALHSYLAVGDIARAQIEGLLEASYLDRVGEHTPREQKEPLKITEEVDRIYKSMASHLIRDLDNNRSIFVDKLGSRSTVVWNPWKERCKEIQDLPDRDYTEFVCVETSNAWTDRPTIRPNMSHTLETTIGLRPLG